MPAKPETKLQQKIRKALVEYGGEDIYIVKNHGGVHTIPGMPDFTGCYKGYFFGMEVKMPNRAKKLTLKQAHHLATIRRAGGYSGVVTTEKEAVTILKKIDEVRRNLGPKREAA